MPGDALTGEVLELAGGRWRVVHLGDQVPVVDRRAVTDQDRAPTFGAGSGRRGLKPATRPNPHNPHSTTWRPTQ